MMKMAVFFSCITSGLGYADAGTSKEAWEVLVGPKFKESPEFHYVKNNPKLPNVLIYGDSISIHYTQEVRDNLKDKVNVYRLYRNGGESATFIQKMDNMLNIMTNNELENHWSFNWNIIHFNVGLHDLKYLKDRKLDKVNGTQVSSLADYKKNLIDIIHYLKKLSPNAKLIFATTTPVPEEANGRIAGDSMKYNIAALEVLKAFPEISINDLYSFTKPNQSQWWVKPGDVHYKRLGQQAQGDEVARIIKQSLSLK